MHTSKPRSFRALLSRWRLVTKQLGAGPVGVDYHMADVSTTQTLFLGVMGGAIPIAVKYVIDRFTESHKAELGVRAKRRERYFDNQATVIAGMYEKLAGLVYALHELYFDETDFIREVATVMTTDIKEMLPPAKAAHKHASIYFASNELYFSQASATLITSLLVHIGVAIDELDSAVDEGLDKVTEDDVKTITSCHQMARTALEQLHTEFRALMLGEQRSSPSFLWAWPKFFRRTNPNNQPVSPPGQAAS